MTALVLASIPSCFPVRDETLQVDPVTGRVLSCTETRQLTLVLPALREAWVAGTSPAEALRAAGWGEDLILRLGPAAWFLARAARAAERRCGRNWQIRRARQIAVAKSSRPREPGPRRNRGGPRAAGSNP